MTLAFVPILVVDDNATNLKLVDYVLTAKGYAVETALDAAAALRAIAARRPHLILMDLQLPGMDGFELTRLLKAGEETHDIVIVALSAYAMKGDRERAFSAGCDGYIPKPFDTRSLAETVADLLTKGRAPGVP